MAIDIFYMGEYLRVIIISGLSPFSIESVGSTYQQHPFYFSSSGGFQMLKICPA